MLHGYRFKKRFLENSVNINHLAVVAAALASFVIGGLWYSPLLFHKAWMDANGLKEQDLRKSSMGKIFGLSFLFSLIMAYNLAAFLAGPGTTIWWGAAAGGLAGIGWVALSIGILGLFERRSHLWPSAEFAAGAVMTIAVTAATSRSRPLRAPRLARSPLRLESIVGARCTATLRRSGQREAHAVLANCLD